MGHEQIAAVSFEGKGCTISQAARYQAGDPPRTAAETPVENF
jgi:hypothetical protein